MAAKPKRKTKQKKSLKRDLGLLRDSNVEYNSLTDQTFPFASAITDAPFAAFDVATHFFRDLKPKIG